MSFSDSYQDSVVEAEGLALIIHSDHDPEDSIWGYTLNPPGSVM